MAGRKKHAQRSRKTYKERMRLARMNLMGSLPFSVLQTMVAMRRR